MAILSKALLAKNIDGIDIVLASNGNESIMTVAMDYYRAYFTDIAASPTVSDEDSAKMMRVIRSLYITDVMVTPVEAI